MVVRIFLVRGLKFDVGSAVVGDHVEFDGLTEAFTVLIDYDQRTCLLSKEFLAIFPALHEVFPMSRKARWLADCRRSAGKPLFKF
jgi:hypothetical protein